MHKSLKILLFAEFIFIFGASLFGPIYAIFVQKIGGDILDAGIAWAIFLISMASLEYPVGKIVDRVSKKKLLVSCYVLASITIFAYIFVSNIYQLFFLQLLMGVAYALGDPAWDAWFSNLSKATERGHDWAMFHLVEGYGQGFAAIIGGILAQFVGFKILFIVGGIIALVGSFFCLLAKEPDFWTRTTIHRHRHFRKKFMEKELED